MLSIRNGVLASVSLLVLASPALAQPVEAPADQGATDEIVVTGTLVRGAAPTGTTVIGVDRSAVEASGATNVTQLLQTVPQLASFATVQAPQGGGNTVTTNRPNLRNLPASNVTGGSTTLMLIDGHRAVGMGITTTSPDLDTIAPGAIERVDIVPDGGSSIYGADAVGGVINFVTRKTFDGLAVNGRFGFGDEYQSWDANATVGKAWSGGGIYISYNYSEHDAIFGRDRDYIRQYPVQSPTFAVPVAGIECPQGANVRLGTSVYGLPLTPSPGAKLNQPNECDYSDWATRLPQERRHSVFASLTQDLSESLNFALTTFFMDRTQRAVNNGYFHTNKPIGIGGGQQLNSPFRSSYIINSPDETQQVYFAWGGADANRQEVHLQAWGVTPTFTAKLGQNWQARLLFNYGESTTTAHSPIFNDTALNNAIRAGLFNPYDPQSSDPAALAAIANFETFGQAKQSQLQARAIVDGDLFELPGGAIKLAVGAEFLRETLRTQKGDIVPGTQDSGFPVALSLPSLPASAFGGASRTIIPVGAGLPIFHAQRNVKSVFGEIVFPVLKDSPGAHELTLSASGRYDSYSDAGDTFNPRFGLTWKPLDQLRIRAQWGKSFSAPSLANSADADPSRASWNSGPIFSIFVPAAAYPTLTRLGYALPTGANSNILTLTGGSNDLKPQTAQTWSVGADVDPLPGARLSLTYWNVKMNNLIDSPVGTAAGDPRFFEQFRASYTINPNQAQIEQLLSKANNFSGTACSPLPDCAYVIEYLTTQNLGKFKQSGLDFAVSYSRQVDFGSVDFSWAGSYILDRQLSVSATAPLVDQLQGGTSTLKFRTTVGADVGPLRAQVMWNHSAGYDLDPADAGLPGFYPSLGHVDAFNTIDLFLKYNFTEGALTKDLALTLTVTNLFDADPPIRYVPRALPNTYGYANGSTLGRVVQIGFSKAF